MCGEDHHPSLMRPDKLPLAFCGSCQLWYVSNLPPLEEIHQLYQGYWFTFRPKDLSPLSASRLISDEGLLEDDIRLNRLSALSGGLEGKRLLEIGCGCGEFLVGARRRGASVFGNDISPEACSFVREQLHFPVSQGPLHDSAFTAEFGAMDIVAMSDLIEHPVEPLRTFESALKVLKPGGLLLILTPNGGEASDDLRGAMQWVGFRVNLDHLQYLSTATILALACRYGCRIEHLETFGYPWLEGIEDPPTGTAATVRSLKSCVKARLKKIAAARKLVRAVRASRDIFAGSQRDGRCGTYNLFAILRRMRSPETWPENMKAATP
ncbi:MAG: class I SAM-dependent methyltransferase [Bryobacteraceae bacterium]